MVHKHRYNPKFHRYMGILVGCVFLRYILYSYRLQFHKSNSKESHNCHKRDFQHRIFHQGKYNQGRKFCLQHIRNSSSMKNRFGMHMNIRYKRRLHQWFLRSILQYKYRLVVILLIHHKFHNWKNKRNKWHTRHHK
jgi:hypothetical protein